MIRKVSFVTDELPAAPRFSLLFQVDDGGSPSNLMGSFLVLCTYQC